MLTCPTPLHRGGVFCTYHNITIIMIIITSLSFLLFAGLPLVSPDLLVNVRVNSPDLSLPLVRPAAGDGQEDVQHDAVSQSHHSLV